MMINPNELKILVIEDDDFQRKMLVNMLHSLGVTSLSNSGNGKRGLEMMNAENEMQTDIVVCDLNMPEMDGLEFVRHLAEKHNHVAIIIISALGSKLVSSAARMARMYGVKLLGVIEKPITLDQFKLMFEKYERFENKLKQPAVTENFTLKEILDGISAQQFEPFFQPKIDFNTGRIVGAEALSRWIHPKHGVMGPYAFIPQLEQSGNIDDLTFVMLEKAAAACHSFHDSGYPLTVAVNLSTTSLGVTALAEKITRVVHKSGIDPRYITLEITESAAMTDVAHALENLLRLSMNGFALSIDDYGTGYSSMQQLTRIPFSELKIDQSFVKDLADNEALRIVVESSIEMAHKLKVKSVAEGVESQQDWDMLKRMGCDTAQGYFIARPMSVTAFHDFLTSYKSKITAPSPDG